MKQLISGHSGATTLMDGATEETHGKWPTPFYATTVSMSGSAPKHKDSFQNLNTT